MNHLRVLSASAVLLGASVDSVANAQLTNFNGAGTATALVGPNAGCAPLPFQGIANGSGTSDFGSFAYSHTACTSGATGPVLGTYTFNFGADQFTGNFAGTSAATPTVGLFDLNFVYNILSGTGRFAGTTGAFTGIGTVDVRGGPPSQLSLTFSAVPEPTTWALMLLGFGAIGTSLRRRTRPIAAMA
jgi:hypothetical protein